MEAEAGGFCLKPQHAEEPPRPGRSSPTVVRGGVALQTRSGLPASAPGRGQCAVVRDPGCGLWSSTWEPARASQQPSGPLFRPKSLPWKSEGHKNGPAQGRQAEGGRGQSPSAAPLLSLCGFPMEDELTVRPLAGAAGWWLPASPSGDFWPNKMLGKSDFQPRRPLLVFLSHTTHHLETGSSTFLCQAKTS